MLTLADSGGDLHLDVVGLLAAASARAYSSSEKVAVIRRVSSPWRSTIRSADSGYFSASEVEPTVLNSLAKTSYGLRFHQIQR